MLCIDYYEARQRKSRTNSWNDCHSRVEGASRQQQTAKAQKKICLLLGCWLVGGWLLAVGCWGLGLGAAGRWDFAFRVSRTRFSNYQLGFRPGRTALLRRAAARIKKAAALA
jgi:hypothetical protein